MANKWIKYKLKRRPWVDGEGKVLESIKGRQNRPGIDEFSGGGYEYPDEVDKIDRFESQGYLVLLVDETKTESLLNKNKDFNGVILEEPLSEMLALGLSDKATLNPDLTIKHPQVESL